MKRTINLLVLVTLLALTFGAVGATPAHAIPHYALGTYPATNVVLGGNTTVTPDVVPTGTTSISVYTDTNFKGIFAADPTTGVVQVTNAHPAGTYTVTVQAFGGSPATTTFTLTVNSGTACTGTTSFTSAGTVSTGSGTRHVAVGDFNIDGNQDLAAANFNVDTVSIRLGDGTGGFSGTTNISVGDGPSSVLVGDFNGDGYQDFATANFFSQNVSIRLGDGAGGFSGTTTISVAPGTPQSIVGGDFNNDGKLDFATANSDAIPGTVSISLGNGDGTFGAATTITIVGSNDSYDIALGDFDQDGNQDFATANFWTQTVSIRLGDGVGGFSGTTDIVMGFRPMSVVVGNFNGDGYQDIAVAGQFENSLRILLGNGSGGFTPMPTFFLAGGPRDTPVSDFNNDGIQDFPTANAPGSSVSILLGDNTGVFTPLTTYSLLPDGYENWTMLVADFNNDGKQDFATANNISGNVSVFLGECLPNHTVTFHANGGAGSMLPQPAAVPTALTLNAFTLPGYTFTGWDTSPAGTTVVYANGATYDFSADIDLYAVWKPDILGDWNVSGLWNGESESDTCGALVAPFPSSSNAAYYGLDGTCTFNAGNTSGWLSMKSAVSLPASGTTLLSFYSYEQTECTGVCSYDYRSVYISTDGVNWNLLGNLGTENTWYKPTYDISAYNGSNVWVRFSFNSVDSYGNNYFGWMVDDILINNDINGDLFFEDFEGASDMTPPVVTVPSDITAEATSSSGAVVTFSASATDETSPANPAVSCSPASGSTFALGTTPVTCSAIDDAGNTGYGYFNVNVVDTTDPGFGLVVDNPYEATGPGGANAAYNASFFDDVSGMASQSCTPASGSLFPIGTTMVNCTGTDNAGNTSNVSFGIQVVDTTAPTLNVPANITVPQTIPAGAVVNFVVTASDIVDASPTVSCTPASGSTFPVGTTTVNCSATDDYSNTSNGSFTVTVTAATGGNLLKKPDFASATVFPSPWQAFGFKPPYAAALDCKIFNFGSCSVLFQAGNRSAMQRVVRSGVAGDTYSFGMYSAANNAPAGGKYLVEVAFYNNYNRLVGISQLNFNLGTHGFELVSGPAVATGNYNKITFRFYYQNPIGRAWFDDAFLYFVGAP